MNKSIVYVMLITLLASIATATPGAIWTTDAAGVPQDQNIYAPGQWVYIKAANLEASATCPYEIIDVGQGNLAIFNGDVTTDSNGDIITPQFVFDTTSADDGVYKVEVTCPGAGKKSDNFKVEGADDGDGDVPEFTTIGAALALAGAGFVVWRRKR